MKKIKNKISNLGLDILIGLSITYLYFFKFFKKIKNRKDIKKSKKLFNKLNKNGMGIYEIKYLMEHGKKFPCNYQSN